MKPIIWRAKLLSLVLWGVLLTTTLAQNPLDKQSPITDTSTLSAETIQSTLAQLNASSDIDAAIKQQLVGIYEAIQAELKGRVENEKFYKELLAAFESAPQATNEAKKRKETPSFVPVFLANNLPMASIEQLQAYQLELQSLHQAASDRKSGVDSAIVTRESKKKELPKLLSDAKAAITKLSEEISVTAPEGTDPRLREATLLLLRTRLLSLNERVRRLEQEQRTYDAENELLGLRKDIFGTEQRHYQSKLKEVAAELGQRRESLISRQKQIALAFLEKCEPELRSSAEQVVRRCEGWLQLVQKTSAIQFETDATEAEFKLWSERYRIMSDKIAPKSATHVTNFNSFVGYMLRKQRAELPDTSKLRAKLYEFQKQIFVAQTLILELDDWKASTSVESNGQVPEYEQQLADRLLDSGVDEQRRILKAIENKIVDEYRVDASSHFDGLFHLADKTEQQITQVTEYQAFIDEHILWIRSSDQFQKQDAMQLWPTTTWLVQLSSWTDVWGALAVDMQRRIWLYVFASAVLLVMFGNLGRMKRENRRLGGEASQPNCTSFLPTAQSIGMSIVMASSVPMLLLFLGYRLYQSDEANSFVLSAGMGLMVAARYYFPLELVRRICSSHGLAESHFGWPEQSALLLRKNLRWFIHLSIPAVGIVGMISHYAEARYENSLGRVAYGVAMILYSSFLFLCLHPGKGVFSHFLKEHAGGWIDRLRYVWYTALGIGPLILGAMSFMGYHYTSVRLAMHLQTTLVTLCGILLIYCVIHRWLLLRRRQILLVQARQRIEEAIRKEPRVVGTDHVPIDTEWDLAEINAQTIRLVGSILIFASIGAVAMIWSTVLPAVGVLNTIPLGWTVDGIGPNEKIPITLANLIIAIPIAIMTVVAARNLPGLLEIALLQHLPIENAVRYAISTISRYAILILGIILTFSNLGVRWTNIQWLVAALGVGLGFGLQEIFANFVSGLILLFEQPVRVGDVITLENTTGTVSKIRMRATTVINFERQELIIPNKDLVTGRLLNWTLSDTTNRMMLKVGVSFESDPAIACELIEQCCLEHPNILKDPAPTAYFERFGESTLELTVRFFLDDLAMRLPTQHELHIAIRNRFAKAQIQISFPQRDLHIRSLPPEIAKLFEGSRDQDRNLRRQAS